MRAVRITLLVFVWGAVLVILSASASASSVVKDLDQVEGIERLKGPESARRLLKKNGFAVVPRHYRQIFSPYVQESLPAFVTTDSIHRTFHVIFEEQLKKVENQFLDDVQQLTEIMLRDLRSRAESDRMTAQERKSAQIAVQYFQVGKALLEGRTASQLRESGEVSDVVVREVELIMGQQGKAASPLFDYPDSPYFAYRLDYSQFKPRGFYTETASLRRYFRAMTWYGNCAFRLVSDRETRVAILITKALQRHPEALKRWKKMDRIYSYLLAEPDDLTPLQYADVLSQMEGKSSSQRLERFRKLAEELPDPGVNSMVIPPGLMPRWRELSKGMRLFGKRYTPDAETFMHLTYPEVPKRWFPSGLDIMAVMGSQRARTLQEKIGATGKAGYEEGFEESREMFGELMEQENPSHYVHTMKLTQTLLDGPNADDLPFMKTLAYRDKNLMTALAAWTSLRHAWMLHAKQSVTYAGGRMMPPTGRVEPNFEFYERMHRLVQHTLQVLEPIEGIDRQRLRRLDRLVQDIERIGRKQVKGKPLGREEKRVLQDYGPTIAKLAYFEGSSYSVERNLPWMALVADVFTEHFTGKCLEEAVGAAMPIYVIVPQDGKRWLMVGGVYSYYEFKRPISQRLTDEKWRQMVESGNTPPRPEWTSSFVAGYGATSLTERVRCGECVPAAQYVNSPDFTEFLRKAIKPGGTLEGKSNPDWAVKMYRIKAGEDAVPTMLDYLSEGWKPEQKEFQKAMRRRLRDIELMQFRLNPRARGAAAALLHTARVKHLPELEKIATQKTGEVAGAAVTIIASMRKKQAESCLVRVARRGGGTRSMALARLRQHGSLDIIPDLLDIYANLKSSHGRGLVEGLARMVTEGRPESRWRWPADVSAERAAKLRKKVEAVVRDALKPGGSRSLLDGAVSAAATLGLQNQVSRILEIYAEHPHLHGLVRSLHRLGGEEAVEALLLISYVEEHRFAFGSDLNRVVEALGETGKCARARVTARLLEIGQSELRRTEQSRDRIRQAVLRALQKLYPENPLPEGHVRNEKLSARLVSFRDYLREEGLLRDEILDTEERIRIGEILLNHAPSSLRHNEPSQAVAHATACISILERADDQAAELKKKAHKRLLEWTGVELKELAERLRWYADDHGNYPAPDTSLKQVLGDDYEFDPGRLTDEGYYVDAWSNRYRLRRPSGGSPLLYSCGPNGKDEQGQGDDVMVQLPRPQANKR